MARFVLFPGAMTGAAQAREQGFNLSDDSSPSSQVELNAAAALQKSWLPSDGVLTSGRVTVACSATSAVSCGGDLCAVYPLGDAVLVVMGDAAGHGLDAALLSGVVKGACDVAVQSVHPLSPPRLLELLNSVVLASGGGLLTMSCTVALVASRTMTVASAGHPLPYVMRAGGRSSMIPAHGCLLGVGANPTYRSLTVRLSPGDRVLWYSDGVVDCENTAGSRFGERRLRDFLSRVGTLGPRGLVCDLETELLWFRGRAPLVDDTTFAVAGVR